MKEETLPNIKVYFRLFASEAFIRQTCALGPTAAFITAPLMALPSCFIRHYLLFIRSKYLTYNWLPQHNKQTVLFIDGVTDTDERGICYVKD